MDNDNKKLELNYHKKDIHILRHTFARTYAKSDEESKIWAVLG